METTNINVLVGTGGTLIKAWDDFKTKRLEMIADGWELIGKKHRAAISEDGESAFMIYQLIKKIEK